MNLKELLNYQINYVDGNSGCCKIVIFLMKEAKKAYGQFELLHRNKEQELTKVTYSSLDKYNNSPYLQSTPTSTQKWSPINIKRRLTEASLPISHTSISPLPQNPNKMYTLKTHSLNLQRPSNTKKGRSLATFSPKQKTTCAILVSECFTQNRT